MSERLYWVGFSLFPGIGPGRFAKLLAYFGSAQEAWHASLSELQNTKIGNKLTEEFVAFRKLFSVEHYQETLQKNDVSFVTLVDKEYPQLLAHSKNPPFVLFTKGQFSFSAPENQYTVGVVGTRRVTSYGREMTQRLTQDLVMRGSVIVSGLAFGVDAVAHQTTIASGGKTIAVLGCGIDCCSPRENSPLYNSIVTHGGVIVSEYGLGVSPTKGSFPSRNRIIAGLSRGVVVTEGAEDSGALITAQDAWSNDRKVFAVPGPATSTLSYGPYKLLKNGAILVRSAQEIIDEIGSITDTVGKTKKQIVGDTKEEQHIIHLLEQESLHFDELVRLTQLESSYLGTLLSLMEMKGFINQVGAGTFGVKNK